MSKSVQIGSLLNDPLIGSVISEAINSGIISLNSRFGYAAVDALRFCINRKNAGRGRPTYKDLNSFTTSPNTKARVLSIAFPKVETRGTPRYGHASEYLVDKYVVTPILESHPGCVFR